MKIAAIIPVKTFSKAKTRLNLSSDQTQAICRLMLEEVVRTISSNKNIEKIIIVSKDEEALSISVKNLAQKKFLIMMNPELIMLFLLQIVFLKLMALILQ